MDSAEGDTQKLSGKRIGPGRSSGKWGSILTPKVQPEEPFRESLRQRTEAHMYFVVVCAFLFPRAACADP